MKKTLCALLSALLILMLTGGALAEEVNLLQNGDFSETDGDLPARWRRDMWLNDSGVSKLTLESDGYEGNCIRVENVDANDARFAQTVAVEPNTLYRVSGRVKAEGCNEDGYGATISIGGIFVYSDSFYDTGEEWELAELYGETGDDQTELTIFCRVGGYSQLDTGIGWFDDISVVEVDDVPDDAYIEDFSPLSGGSDQSDDVDENAEPARTTESFVLFAVIYVLVVLGITRKRGRSAEKWDSQQWTTAFIMGLMGAMLARLLLALRVRGYNTDINCFTAWSERMFANGPAHFYAPEYFCDYPPLYMLLLWPVGLVRHVTGLATDSAVYLMLLKLIPMLADIGGAVLVWKVAKRRLSDRTAVALGLLAAFNPAALVNSAAWGQIDGLLTLFIALCALYAIDGRVIPAMLCFAAALLTKPQSLLVAPLGLLALVLGIVRAEAGEARRKRLRETLLGVLLCLAIAYIVAFFCCLDQAQGIEKLTKPIPWMIELYSGAMRGYRYVTVNTLNLYELLGLNWAHAEDHGGIMLIAWIAFAAAYVYCFALLIASKKPNRLFLTGGLLVALVCMFGPMMHERYIFPAMLLLTLAYACERDKRVLISLTALTAVLFMNEVLVLQGGMTSANYGHLQSAEDWLNRPLCVINLLNTLFLAWTAFDICVFNRTWPMKALPREEIPAGAYSLREPASYKMGIKRLDVLLMAAVTLAYSVLTFVNLGTLSAPQTNWVSSISGENVTFDLGETQPFRMTYYGGICNTSFHVELSNDGENWTEPVHARYDQGEIFRWLWFVPSDESDNDQAPLKDETVPAKDGRAYIVYAGDGESYPMQTARYVRITADSAGLTLSEVGFLDADGHALPIQGITQEGQTEDATSAALLIDEQSTVAAYPSYLNSTYFDEIYHARTAYEHLHAMNTYEWTHPPLGKVTMMIGIQLFGMTPFGWRFMGALFGVMMLPVMYLLVKQLTKRTDLSVIAMGLMALDSMHFTQTRIATIDSYAVFWIMLMYLFMFRYCQMSWNRESLGKTLVPLGLCGVTMGVAWATKWIGIYASAGLAILFFWTVFRRLREVRYLPRGKEGFGKLLITLGFCLVFFVAVPLLIYYLSYGFQLHGEGVNSVFDMFSAQRLQRVLKLQRDIFNYHSGLGGDTHYFRSPWYQWPVIWWPMWYYSGTAFQPEGVISSISCMGNPAVWWFGLASLIAVLVRMCWKRRANTRAILVTVGFASQFLPWVIVPRSTFIYHYFASVPFIIMASALVLQDIRSHSMTAWRVAAGILLGAALVLFIAFYPLESGLPVARSYAQYLRWFQWYNF